MNKGKGGVWHLKDASKNQEYFLPSLALSYIQFKKKKLPFTEHLPLNITP